MPVDTFQGALPVMRVGLGRAFLALAQPPAPPGIHHVSLAVNNFDVDRIFSVLEDYGLTILGKLHIRASGPLQVYVTIEANRGGFLLAHRRFISPILTVSSITSR